MPEYYLLQGEVENDLALMKGIFTDYSADIIAECVYVVFERLSAVRRDTTESACLFADKAFLNRNIIGGGEFIELNAEISGCGFSFFF